MINIFSLLLSLLNNAYFISYIKSKTFDLPLTFKEEQFYLQKKCNGDKAARDLLIEKNLRLVAHIAKKYNNNRDKKKKVDILYYNRSIVQNKKARVTYGIL